MTQAIFWISVFLIVYPYAIYPLLIALLGAVRARPVQKKAQQPSVSVLIPAYNEADCIAATLEHQVAQDYPKDRLQILVVSDGSDDGTDDIVRTFAPRGVELLRREDRGGKALGLNAAVRQARGDIVVFCDANARFKPDAIRNIAANFADPSVGYLTGSLTLEAADATMSGSGGGAYLKFENALRRAETKIGSVIGVNGGCDAIRRELYSDIPKDLITDFVLPLRVIAAGHRVVFDPDVRSTEEPNTEMQSEFRMRVRVALRALQGLMHMRRLFNPLRYPLTSFCLTSHKLLRYFAFVFLIGAMASNIMLALGEAPAGLYTCLLGGQVLCYVLALLGLSDKTPGPLRRIATVPTYLVMTYAAFAWATVKFLRGQSMATWQPRAG